jgi:hypothetical protein
MGDEDSGWPERVINQWGWQERGLSVLAGRFGVNVKVWNYIK